MSRKPSISENQAKAPLCAAFVKAMRETFGDVAVIYVREGEVKLGEKSEEVFAIA